MHDGFEVTVRAANTNREHKHVDTRDPSIEAEIGPLNDAIQAFVNSNDPKQLRDLLLDEFKKLGALEDPAGCLQCYRGLDKNLAAVGKRIGPNPKADSEGRYHRKGGKALYLTDSLAFLKCELGVADYVVQTYSLPLTDLCLADISSGSSGVPNVLCRAFDIAESGKDMLGENLEDKLEQQGRSRRDYSQRLALLAEQAGWDGFCVPGVHGESNSHYRNIVILGDTVDAWEQWTEGDWRDYQS